MRKDYKRVRKHLSLEKAEILGNVFVDSPFSYAALKWMFCRKELYLKVQKIHHKTLMVVYQSKETCEELLELKEFINKAY